MFVFFPVGLFLSEDNNCCYFKTLPNHVCCCCTWRIQVCSIGKPVG